MNETVNVQYAELPWPEAQRRLAQGAVVFLPLGATEQHGYHMARNVDVVLPSAIAERAAQAVSGLVLPPLAYGVRSQPRTGGGPAFGGTINLRAGTFSAIVSDVLTDLMRQGARRIVLINGHYENIGPSIEGIELAFDQVGRHRSEDVTVLRLDHWEMVKPQTLERIFPDGYPGIELEHASVIETSMMLALRPALVDPAKALHDGPAHFKPYDRYPRPTDNVPPSGVLSLTEGASAQKGQWLLDDCHAGILAMLRNEFGDLQ